MRKPILLFLNGADKSRHAELHGLDKVALFRFYNRVASKKGLTQ